ncbi:hypothetical protein [Trujillonella humicola]|uniref:hypothetical protein n=1 Tax=Trujillonella humicola TaxID=3383699 RepID=UPI003906CEFA
MFVVLWLLVAAVLSLVVSRALHRADCLGERGRGRGAAPVQGAARVFRGRLVRPDLDDLAPGYGWQDREPWPEPGARRPGPSPRAGAG